ncbi:MAG: hypothetical protein LLG06_03540 [Desulfobacteraceae bacterium]|nr:hypothetical protein [Desulfobacteraceae bacterium]
MNRLDPSKGPSEADAPGLPDCFADGDKVCPLDEEGIMQPQADCIPCPHLRPCLQLVMHRRGKIRLVEAPPSAKVTGFFKRWSERKLGNSEKS